MIQTSIMRADPSVSHSSMHARASPESALQSIPCLEELQVLLIGIVIIWEELQVLLVVVLIIREEMQVLLMLRYSSSLDSLWMGGHSTEPLPVSWSSKTS